MGVLFVYKVEVACRKYCPALFLLFIKIDEQFQVGNASIDITITGVNKNYSISVSAHKKRDIITLSGK